VVEPPEHKKQQAVLGEIAMALTELSQQSLGVYAPILLHTLAVPYRKIEIPNESN
jgi:hypothetical protein